MNTSRMSEGAINASLDAHLHGARQGNAQDAKKLHEMLDAMLSEREIDQGQMWLTEHGKRVLADMHRRLGQCGGKGDELKDIVLEAMQFKPHTGHWDDTCSYLRDLRVALAVANELCIHRDAGNEPNLALAAEEVAESSEFGMEPAQICEVYDEIASTVKGFKAISSH